MSDELLKSMVIDSATKKKDVSYIKGLVQQYLAEEKAHGSTPHLGRSTTKGRIDEWLKNVAGLVASYQENHASYVSNLRPHEIEVAELVQEVSGNTDKTERIGLKHKCAEIGAESEAMLIVQRALSNTYSNLNFVVTQINRMLPRNYHPNPVAKVNLKKPPSVPKTPKLPNMGVQITKAMTTAALAKISKSDD